MPVPIITAGVVFEDAGAFFMARIVGNDAANITQASLNAITCKVIDHDDTGSTVLTPTVTIATSVFDTLQTDARWTKDTTGYNFGFAMPATTFATGLKKYRVEFSFDPDTGEDFKAAFDVDAKALFGS